MTRPGIKPQFLGPLANTLPTRPMSWFCLYQRILRVSFLRIASGLCICEYGEIWISSTIPVDQLSQPVVFVLVFLLCYFVVFLYKVINYFTIITT